MTLSAFIQNPLTRNEHVTHKKFSALYVRKAKRVLDKGILESTFDIGAVEAKKKGQGHFTALIEELKTLQSDPIFVESVLTERFATGLVKMGFTPIGEGNFFLRF